MKNAIEQYDEFFLSRNISGAARYFEAAVILMDDEVREFVDHLYRYSPNLLKDPYVYLQTYCLFHKEKYNSEFLVN